MKDSFGIEIEPGDYILSASTTRGRVKVGTAKQGVNGLLMTVDLSATYGAAEEDHPKTGQLGTNVVVLRKANGDVPPHIGGEGHRLVINGKSHAVEEMELQDIEEDAFSYLVWVPRDREMESE